MAVKAGTAYVEVKYDPDSIRNLRRDALATGKAVAKSWDDADDGLIDFDRAAKNVNKTMSGGPGGLFDAIGNVGYALLRMGSFAQKGTDSLGKLFSSVGDGEGVMASLGSALSGLAPLAGIAATGFVALGAALLVLPALAAAATFVLVALLDTVTILTAVVVALLGPLTVLGALLGGLAAGFVIGGKKALEGTGQFKEFGKTIKDLKKQFDELGNTLGSVFLPYFERLAGAAKVALSYLNRIAKLPLKEAFQSLATDGVRLLSKFLYGVANVLKKPFKLAIQIAFGSGGATAQSAITNWWDSLTDYLFGYTKTRPIHIGSKIVMEQKNIRGALDPIIDWFNSQHFVATGIRWAHEIIDGLIRLWNHNRALRDAVKAVLNDAGHMAGKAFKAAFFAEVRAIPWRALGWWLVRKLDLAHGVSSTAKVAFNQIKPIAGAAFDWVKNKAISIWHSITNAASNAAHSAGNAIRNAFGAAINWVRSKISGLWDYIKGLFSQVLTIHINIPTPSIPDFHIPGTAAGGTTTRSGLQWVGERGPELLNMPRGAQVIPLDKMGVGGGDVYISIDGRVLDERVDYRVSRSNQSTARTVKAGRRSTA